MSVDAVFRRRGPSFWQVIGGGEVSMNRVQALTIMVIVSIEEI